MNSSRRLEIFLDEFAPLPPKFISPVICMRRLWGKITKKIPSIVEKALREWLKKALFTFTVRISVGRKRSDVVVCDEGIAPAMSEEQNATDDPFAVDRKLTAKVNKAEKGNLFS